MLNCINIKKAKKYLGKDDVGASLRSARKLYFLDNKDKDDLRLISGQYAWLTSSLAAGTIDEKHEEKTKSRINSALLGLLNRIEDDINKSLCWAIPLMLVIGGLVWWGLYVQSISKSVNPEDETIVLPSKPQTVPTPQDTSNTIEADGKESLVKSERKTKTPAIPTSSLGSETGKVPYQKARKESPILLIARTISGKVVDIKDKPITNVIVSTVISEKSYSSTTDELGKYLIDVKEFPNHITQLKVSVEKSGYKASGRWNETNNLNDVNFKLKRND